jgi:hypothetical protein
LHQVGQGEGHGHALEESDVAQAHQVSGDVVDVDEGPAGVGVGGGDDHGEHPKGVDQ